MGLCILHACLTMRASTQDILPFKDRLREGVDYTLHVKIARKAKLKKKDMYFTRHGFQKMSRRLLIIARWLIFSICFVLLLITRRKRRNQEPAENDYEEGKKSPTHLKKCLDSKRESL